ncbi:hypothetical protein AMECASPLE_030536 [Ameca splendens]|uniref:Uncharacterized protein n=1 Tax=Ameca splendens TaxID=208324 RepID=A0ABV1A4L6_9TELE
MCATSAACFSRIAAWSMVVQRATWLHLSPSIPEDLQKDMLEGPITPDVLFGPNFQTIQSQKTDEVSETVRHLVRPQPNSRTPRLSGRWKDHQRQQQRRTAAAAASCGAPPSTSSSQPQQFFPVRQPVAQRLPRLR